MVSRSRGSKTSSPGIITPRLDASRPLFDLAKGYSIDRSICDCCGHNVADMVLALPAFVVLPSISIVSFRGLLAEGVPFAFIPVFDSVLPKCSASVRPPKQEEKSSYGRMAPQCSMRLWPAEQSDPLFLTWKHECYALDSNGPPNTTFTFFHILISSYRSSYPCFSTCVVSEWIYSSSSPPESALSKSAPSCTTRTASRPEPPSSTSPVLVMPPSHTASSTAFSSMVSLDSF